MFFTDRKSLIARFVLILSLFIGMVGAARVEPVRAATSTVISSVAANDGWILESNETSNLGGNLNAAASTIDVGDDKGNRQSLGVLHFDTSALPDTAVITAITLRVQAQNVTGTDPFTTHGNLIVDIQSPFFGTTAALVAGDFQAAAGQPAVSSFDPVPVNNWYSAAIDSAGYPFINLTGTTQFRLRFGLDDDNDRRADLVKLYSGDAASANRPQLIVEYDVPAITHTISGNVGVGDASLSYLDGEQKTVLTDGGGNYSLVVSDHWSGTITPSKPNYAFVPSARDYVDVQTDLSDQNFAAVHLYTISGNVRYAGVSVGYLEDGELKTSVSDSNGDYSFQVKAGWSGTVTPSMPGVIFEPASRDYFNVPGDQTAQNYQASLIVITVADSGPGSLRQAIANAVPGDVITFHPDLAGQTIVLASVLNIDKNLTIDGSGLIPQITISGNYATHIVIYPATAVTISDIVIANGYSSSDGGGLDALGNLTLLRSTLRNNYASDDGGAIHASAELNIQGTTFYQNRSESAGGAIHIASTASASIVNTTITQNQSAQGGAISVQGSGELSILNATIADNSATSAAGGIFALGNFSTSLENSIVICQPDITGCVYGDPINSTNTIIGVGGLFGYGLSALGDNGGPTYTMALLPDSPATDAGNDASCPATDQRGVARPQGNHCDIGAYEATYTSRTRYVKWDATGLNNGSSWTDAFNDLQSALSVAYSGDEIWVAAGTYKPNSGLLRTESFVLKNDVAVYGGFAGTETLLSQRDYQTNVTILSGDLGLAGDPIDNSYRVVVGSNTNNTAVLDGFTITGAFGNMPSFNQGGGMYIFQGSPTVSNVIFLNNYSEFGGGMFNGGLSPNGSSPVLTNVIFDGNSALEGGGMENMHYSNPILVNVIFRNNSALRSGGGMLNNNYNNPTLTNVTFSGNSADWGGGLANWVNNNPVLNNVTFSGNSADWGGGMGNYQSSPLLTNVTFSGNSAATYGGAISNEMSSSPTLTNVTISGNSAVSFAGGIYDDYNGGIIRNSILYGNIGESIYSSAGSANVSYSIVEGGYPGTGNMNVAPLLGSLQDNGGATQTMAILSGSPAIDAGNDATCASSDQRGVARPQGSHCDIGAYEAQYYTISGNAGAPGVILSYADTIFGVACVALPDGSMSCTNPQPVPASKYHYVTSDQDGNYSFQMPQGWSGIVIPSKPDYIFSPVKRTYSDLSADQLDQDYAPSAVNAVLPPDPGSTRRIVPADAVPSNNPLNFEYLDLSGNGRYVAYVSNSPDLVAGDTNERSDVFVWDRLANTTQRISVNSGGEEANDHSFFPSLSKDGRYIAFESWATNLDPACTWGRNVFVHDMQAGRTFCASVNASGEQSGSTSDRPMISADGRYVVYKSFAYNLVSGDTNNQWDVFVFDIFSRTTVRASVSSTGAQGNSYSENAAISADGRYVAFISNASTLVNSDTNGTYDIFLRDMLNNTTSRVSVNSSGVETNGASFRPAISEDGRFVAFASNGTNLVDGDTNARTDVFVHDTQTATTSRVSLSSDNEQGNNTSTAPAISNDGRFVVFDSYASNLVSNDTNLRGDVFVRDRLTNRTSRVSVASDGSQANYESLNASLSSDGRYVVFESMATNLVSPVAPNRYPDAFLHERDTIAPAVISITRANTNPTSASEVDFTVTFSESVTGVDAGDFVLTTNGIAGASIASVSGSNTTYTVRVNTGTGSGTLRIDVVDNDSIVDTVSNPLGGDGAANGNFSGGESYTISRATNYTVTLNSVAANDGWIAESAETSNLGGTLNTVLSTIDVGDDKANKQYLGILHFDTSGLPDNAVITSVTLRVQRQSILGTDPFTTHGSLVLDIQKPYFGTTAALLTSDFQAAAGVSDVSTFNPVPANNWYSATIPNSGYAYIDATGTTQFRLRFSLDDNNDLGGDVVKFYSGEGIAGTRPELIIEYYVP